jgi:hypothetical protein
MRKEPGGGKSVVQAKTGVQDLGDTVGVDAALPETKDANDYASGQEQKEPTRIEDLCAGDEK